MPECKLITGRTHQIRVQLAGIGCPILGDRRYGNKEINRQYGRRYQSLCACELTFSFLTNAGILEYLNGKTFKTKYRLKFQRGGDELKAYLEIVRLWVKRQSAYRLFVFGFLALIAIGTVLLLLPISLNKSKQLTFLDALFTSTSAVCVTGLVVVDTAGTFTLFGRIVIMLLIQIGGLAVLSFHTLHHCR